ncbi:hypothetical protein RFI_31918 [Reticulomyxa filosa]|uniref:Uncharacterized protein n=1 Tax=Reticulomyxa filosa TaxID=46433 RepID=X6LV48_RETFI|nr:hypothetical protein RFI_31918 [Reticulomyxa filosa]|eukprot:ETO05479.1 hypothetical protein RFI_31918 [Reticulomyxa filosa]
MLEGFAKYWPKQCVVKQEIFINEIVNIVNVMVNHPDVDTFDWSKCKPALLECSNRIAQCVLSMRSMLVERAMAAWNESCMQQMVDVDRALFLPLLIEAFYKYRNRLDYYTHVIMRNSTSSRRSPLPTNLHLTVPTNGSATQNSPVEMENDHAERKNTKANDLLCSVLEKYIKPRIFYRERRASKIMLDLQHNTTQQRHVQTRFIAQDPFLLQLKYPFEIDSKTTKRHSNKIHQSIVSSSSTNVSASESTLATAAATATATTSASVSVSVTDLESSADSLLTKPPPPMDSFILYLLEKTTDFDFTQIIANVQECAKNGTYLTSMERKVCCFYVYVWKYQPTHTAYLCDVKCHCNKPSIITK